MDILAAEQEISTLKDALQEMHAHIDQHHHRLYEEAVQLSERIGIQPSRRRTVQRQVYWDNNPSSPEIYYRINLTQVNMTQESRFADEAYICFKGFSLVSAVLLNNFSTWKSHVEQFCQHYSQDIPNIDGLSVELQSWSNIIGTPVYKRTWSSQFTRLPK